LGFISLAPLGYTLRHFLVQVHDCVKISQLVTYRKHFVVKRDKKDQRNTIATRLRYDDTLHDAFDYDGSDRNYDLRSIRLRYDYDEKLACSFFARVESRRIEADARDT